MTTHGRGEEAGWRGALGSHLPAHFRDPFGLAWRLLRSGSPDAAAAAFQALIGLVATPVDFCLQPFERARVARAGPPERPMLFVVGPPRSGTTLVVQTLIRALPVAYLTNVTTVFPRAPMTAARLLRARLANEKVQPRSHYGRTSRLHGPNDGLQLWDRWIGTDRTRVPETLDPAARAALVAFFGAYEAMHARPVVAKNNSLNLYAALVAEALPTARFVCLRRDPLFLAQSLLQARRHIHGSDSVPYGPHAPDRTETSDPLADVCAQIRFHAERAADQQRRIGDERFCFLAYEDFCEDPAGTVRDASAWLGVDVVPGGAPERFRASRQRTLPAEEFARLERAVACAGIGAP